MWLEEAFGPDTFHSVPLRSGSLRFVRMYRHRSFGMDSGQKFTGNGAMLFSIIEPPHTTQTDSMSTIRDFYHRLRPILGASYGLIILFMFLPFMVVSCGSGDSRTVLAEQSGTEFLAFQLPDAGDGAQVDRNKEGIYIMGGVTWLILLSAVAGLVFVVKNGNLKRVGFIIGIIGSLAALIFMGIIFVGDAKMKEDMAAASEFGGALSINVEVGSGLMMILLLYLATGVFAMLQKKPTPISPDDRMRLDEDIEGLTPTQQPARDERKSMNPPPPSGEQMSTEDDTDDVDDRATGHLSGDSPGT